MRVNFVKTDENLNELDDFIDFWIDKVDCIGVQDLFDFTKNINRSKQKKFNCALPFLLMVVRFNGNLLPCCSFSSDPLAVGKLKNLKSEYKKEEFREEIINNKLSPMSIEEAWKNKKTQYLRKIHKDGTYYKNPVCEKCVTSSYSFD